MFYDERKIVLRGYSGLEFLKNRFFFAYFQSSDLQEYKIDQPEVVITYFNEIFPCLVFSSAQFASSNVDVRTTVGKNKDEFLI